jgi:Domain of unknown function (DUF5666)
MARSSFLRAGSAAMLPVLIFSTYFLASSAACAGQDQAAFAVEGYITAVSTPNGFDVNGMHVITSAETVYGLIGDKTPHHDSSLQSALKMGAYVRVAGSTERQSKSATASAVYFRDDWDKKLAGFGVIDKVIEAGPEPLYEADGYRILIASSTEARFSKGLNALADVGTNTWVKYEGKRNEAGELVATRAEFVPARQGKIKNPPQSDSLPTQPSLIDAKGKVVSAHTKVRYSDAGGVCGWHKVIMDQALQERVRRVGLTVVPAFQRQLADGELSKIQFRFWVVDESQFREDLECEEGLILVPIQVVARLGNEDQLAAVLANGVAFSLIMQGIKIRTNGLEKAGEVADDIALVADPVGTLLIDGTIGSIVSHEYAMKLREQAGRISLALMTDAGYDPWQAPEAWRLLAPKNLPSDLSSLKYPSRSGYQLGILNVQYRAATGVGTR